MLQAVTLDNPMNATVYVEVSVCMGHVSDRQHVHVRGHAWTLA